MRKVVLIGVTVLAGAAGAACGSPAVVSGAGESPIPQTPYVVVAVASPSPLASPGPVYPYIEYVGVSGASCFYPVDGYPLPKGAPACSSDPNKNPWVPPAPKQPPCFIYKPGDPPLPANGPQYCLPPSPQT